jgi:SAM-dependent methyltransferase
MPPAVDWNQRYADNDAPWDSGAPSLELQRVLNEKHIGPSRALEIGCGTGTNAIYLAQQGFDVTAFDLVPLAIERAKAKAAAAKARVRFFAADLEDALDRHDFGPPYPFIFDRGVCHSVRPEGLGAYLRTLRHVAAPGGLLLVLTGNANDPEAIEKGPPRVTAHELCAELGGLFELVELREFRFDGVVIEGRMTAPLAWSGLFRRRMPRE